MTPGNDCNCLSKVAHAWVGLLGKDMVKLGCSASLICSWSLPVKLPAISKLCRNVCCQFPCAEISTQMLFGGWWLVAGGFSEDGLIDNRKDGICHPVQAGEEH